MTTLDRFAAVHKLDRIDLLKTDTENFDLEVIKGGQELLGDGKISFIYSEVGFDRKRRAKCLLTGSAGTLDLRSHRCQRLSGYDIYDACLSEACSPDFSLAQACGVTVWVW